MPFFQSPPELGNTYDDDTVLRGYLARRLPAEVLADVEPELRAMGELSGGHLTRRFDEERTREPQLTSWDPWGRRIDHIELTPLWKELTGIAARTGVVAAAYERRHGEHSRVHQFALAYLMEPASGVFSCPLAMTDGAARTLLASGNEALVARAVGHLTSRDPAHFWTSGQWMTERTGGSDVALTETRAVPAGDGTYRLYGTKWFTSATTSPMALTLARPEGNPPGGSGLALFYVELRDARGGLNGIRVNRLKEKLGTRMVPTAELTLDGAVAHLVKGDRDGIRHITPMLGITRTWNAVGAIAGMRRGLALARDYARRRVAFGKPLSEKPLHLDTLAGLEAELQGAFHLTFRVIQLLGREEAGTATADEGELLRLLTPLAKLTTGRQAVQVASETLEAFGGAGYVEDTGLPRMLRDAQVLPIWEGTTNVLSLDVLRALAKGSGLRVIVDEVGRAVAGAPHAVAEPARRAVEAVAHAQRWLTDSIARGDRDHVEAGARRFALTLGRAAEVALLVEQAAWDDAEGRTAEGAAAARRVARQGVDLIVDERDDADVLLAMGVAPNAARQAP